MIMYESETVKKPERIRSIPAGRVRRPTEYIKARNISSNERADSHRMMYGCGRRNVCNSVKSPKRAAILPRNPNRENGVVVHTQFRARDTRHPASVTCLCSLLIQHPESTEPPNKT